MASIAVQAGHCFRKSGATGSPGEQHFADRVSRRAVALLKSHGHSAVRVLADGVNYRAWDYFFAVHFDANGNSSIRGASVGYRNHSRSRQLAAAWKTEYRRDWPYSFRGDNYTTGLSGYYGNRLAIQAGTKAAIICEFGFGTNPTERQWMEANIETCARSIANTVSTMEGGKRVDDDSLPLTVGSRGPNVKSLQVLLNAIRTQTTPNRPRGTLLNADGVFGEFTRREVVRWGAKAGLSFTDESNPRVGEKTLTALKSLHEEEFIVRDADKKFFEQMEERIAQRVWNEMIGHGADKRASTLLSRLQGGGTDEILAALGSKEGANVRAFFQAQAGQMARNLASQWASGGNRADEGDWHRTWEVNQLREVAKSVGAPITAYGPSGHANNPAVDRDDWSEGGVRL